jgi:hypothetical protein
VAAYATPKLETSLVREAADALSSAAFMPQLYCKTRMAVNDAMLTAVSQKVLNAAKSIGLVGVSLCENLGLVFFRKEACAMDDPNTNVNNVIVGDGMLGEVGKYCSPGEAHDKQFESL